MSNEMKEKMSLVILQADQEEAEFHRARFEELGMRVLGICGDGTRGVDFINEHQPDAVLMDGFLPGRNCDEILEALMASGYRRNTVFAVISQVPNDRLARNVMDAGADLFLLPPMDYAFMRDRIIALGERKKEALRAEEKDYELERYVANLMHDMGVPAHIRGYDYIRDSIMLALEDRHLLKAITKELYPTIAKNNATTSSRVERAIRHAIEVAWGRGDIDTLNSIFGFTVKSSKGKPTNGEFISMITERIRLDLKIA